MFKAIAASRDVTSAAAKAVLDERSVPVTTKDTAAGLVGNTGCNSPPVSGVAVSSACGPPAPRVRHSSHSLSLPPEDRR